MDDQRFDDIIKEKVGNYEDPAFDPSALSAFHHQLANVSSWPWYTRYRTELLIVSGMALCTFLIIVSQWYFAMQKSNLQTQHAAEIGAQQQQIKKLVHEITILKNLPPDTVYIQSWKENQDLTYSLLLTQRIKNLEGALYKMQKDLEAFQADTPYASADNVNPFEISDNSKDEWTNEYAFSSHKRVTPGPKETLSKHANKKNTKTLVPGTQREVSLETLHDLEKHYHRGIGIRVGPTIDISHGFYDGGASKIDYAGGVLGDFILSPSFSIETGGKFSHRFYEISGDNLSNRSLPNVDHSLGPLVYADVDSWILEIPFNIKYRYPISEKSNFIGSIGYSSRIYTQQIFEYDYSIDGNATARLNTSAHVNKMKMYPSVLNISIGIGHQLKNRKTLETSVFYQYSLGESGAEKMKGDFLGIRSAYWFTIK